MLDVRKLRALRAIARCGSFSAAADHLNYSQSAISQQVAQLERQVGTLLVERRGRTVRLTVAGHKLVDRADRILRHLEDAEAELADISLQERCTVRLVTSGSAVTSWIPAAVTRFQLKHPAHTLDVSSATTAAALDQVALGDVDLAVVPTLPGGVDTNLHVVDLFDDGVRLLLPAGHRLAARPAVKLADFADEEWIVTTRPIGGDFSILLAACQKAGFHPRVGQQVSDELVLQGLVAAGAGVALTPELVCATYLRRDVVARSLCAEEVIYPIVAVAARMPLAGSPAALLLEELLETALEQTSPGPFASRAGAS